jgi:SecD/SecF fusion protein
MPVFKRAFTAIFDSNFCTAMTCCVLFYYGTGPIRGFALTLGLGVGVSMFTAITVTRTFLFSLVNVGVAANAAAYGLEERKYDLHVMRRKAVWLGISLAIIIPGLVAWLFMGGIKKSIDFTGGTELEVPYAVRHSAGDIEKVLSSLGAKYKDSRVVVSSGAIGGAQLAYVTTSRLSIAEREQLQQTLIDKVGPLAAGSHIAYSDVSGTISKELTQDAITAVFIASGLIVLYLTFRFAIGGWKEGLKYGLCAVIALLHDVLVVWGSFAMLGYALNWQVDSLFVTAMLTVIGFSVHDTIIVFDRVRENLHHRVKGENFSDLTDRSIDQTFSRSLKTSFTVVLVLLALFFGGGAIINHFVAALLIGIISGTYSSIFNASVLLVMWKKMDTGLTLTSAGSATKSRSSLVTRPATVQPGDRPLVAPSRAKVDSAPRQKPQPDSVGIEDSPPDATGAKAAARRQAVRRRRM